MKGSVLEFVEDLMQNAPRTSKDAVINYALKKYTFVQDRKVYRNNHFAVRFSYSRNHSFSNTILSLSALEKYDKIPFLVCLLSGQSTISFYLANTTFLKKISHSSHYLSINNIVGSFNGSDIMRSYQGIENKPRNFEKLFAIHQGWDWIDNLERLVEASSLIKASSKRFTPTIIEKTNILNSINHAIRFCTHSNFQILFEDLNNRCLKAKDLILVASRIENVNIRGRIIEYLITTNEEGRKRIATQLQEMENALPVYDTKNGLGDYTRKFEKDDTYTDIKTKVIYLKSNPKAFNIDKFLRCMSEKTAVFLFYFVGINEDNNIETILCPVYSKRLIEGTRIQTHWSGRSSRGVTQFDGEMINQLLAQKDIEIDGQKATDWVQYLLSL